jgi:hypothetical protein
MYDTVSDVRFRWVLHHLPKLDGDSARHNASGELPLDLPETYKRMLDG